jgi:hypothetical protein
MKEPIAVTVNGERWYKFFAPFTHADRIYSFNFYARNRAEAEEMLRAIRTTAVECHQIQGEIPASIPGIGLLVRAWCAARNFFS